MAPRRPAVLSLIDIEAAFRVLVQADVEFIVVGGVAARAHGSARLTNDVDVVYRTAQRALELARKGGGPSLIEAETYRHGGHSRADPGKYRPDDEVKAWLAKDPLPRYRARLIELGIAVGDIEKIEAETNAEIDRATETARNAPPPPLELADKDVWADGGSSWRN